MIWSQILTKNKVRNQAQLVCHSELTEAFHEAQTIPPQRPPDPIADPANVFVLKGKESAGVQEKRHLQE